MIGRIEGKGGRRGEEGFQDAREKKNKEVRKERE